MRETSSSCGLEADEVSLESRRVEGECQQPDVRAVDACEWVVGICWCGSSVGDCWVIYG